MNQQRQLTPEDIKYYSYELGRIIQVSERHAITLQQLANCCEIIGDIADKGALSIYMRVLFDGARP